MQTALIDHTTQECEAAIVEMSRRAAFSCLKIPGQPFQPIALDVKVVQTAMGERRTAYEC